MTLLGETKTLSHTKERPSNKGEKIYQKGKKHGGGYFFLDTVYRNPLLYSPGSAITAGGGGLNEIQGYSRRRRRLYRNFTG